MKWINFFISNAVVPDEDGNWDGITVWGRAPLAELSLGPGPGQVFCPWTSEEPSAAFSIVALEHDQQQKLWAKDNDNFALQQQLAEKEAAMAEQAAELEKLKSELQQAKAEAATAATAAAMAAAAPGKPASSNQPAQKVQKTWLEQQLKSGWMNRSIALAGAVRQKDTVRLVELVKKQLACLLFLW